MGMRYGLVYFIRLEVSPIVKIGYSGTVSSLQRRLDSLQTSSWETLILIRTMPGSLDTEAGLHERFSSLRLRGEWFRLEPELETYIASIPVDADPVRGDGELDLSGLLEDESVPEGAEDFLDEMVRERAEVNPEYPSLVSETAARRAWARELVSRRGSLGLTQGDVAVRMGTAQSVVSKLEAGGDVMLSTMQRYLSVLGLGLDSLVSSPALSSAAAPPPVGSRRPESVMRIDLHLEGEEARYVVEESRRTGLSRSEVIRRALRAARGGDSTGSGRGPGGGS